MTEYGGTLKDYVNAMEDKGLHVVKKADTPFGHKAIYVEKSLLGRDKICFVYRIFKEPVTPALIDHFVADLKGFIKHFHKKYDLKAQFHHAGYRPEDDNAIRARWGAIHEKLLEIIDYMEEFFPEWDDGKKQQQAPHQKNGTEPSPTTEPSANAENTEQETPLSPEQTDESGIPEDLEKILDEEPIPPHR